MRLWSLHPKYLDRQGLTAVWREGLLAQAVLRGRTKGYRSHPQLDRFLDSGRPFALIASYLHGVRDEAIARGYEFDRTRIIGRATPGQIPVTRGQLQWEWNHLMRKLRARSPEVHVKWFETKRPQGHPIFRAVAGGIADWERGVDEY